MLKTAFIYFLKDPENPNKGYLGKTDNLKRRQRQHLTEGRAGKRNHRTNWIKALTTRGLKPVLEIVDEVPWGEWKFWEREYIKAFKAVGFNLVNGTDGGDGGATMLGKKFTPAHCAAISAGLKGKTKNPEWCAKISAGKLGKKLNLSPEALQKKIDYATGRVHSPESCAKRRKKRPTTSSNFYGVSTFPLRGKWRARINISSKSIHLGLFSDELEAARAYDAAAKIHHGEHAVLNFN